MNHECSKCGKEMRMMIIEKKQIEKPMTRVWDPTLYVGGFGTVLKSELDKMYPGVPRIELKPYMCVCGFKKSFRE